MRKHPHKIDKDLFNRNLASLVVSLPLVLFVCLKLKILTHDFYSTMTMLSLTIKHWNGKDSFQIEIDSTEYIDDLKEKIEELYDVPVDEQQRFITLLDCGYCAVKKEVDDTETLAQNGIQDNSILVMEPMKVTILLPSEENPKKKKKIRISLKPDDTIKKIKRAVLKKVSGDSDNNVHKLEGLVVLFDGNELRDGQKINECNIDHGDVVIVEYFTVTVAHWEGDLIEIGGGGGGGGGGGSGNMLLNTHDTTDKVRDVLLKTEETKDIPRDTMKFKFGGNTLNDFISLKDQNIKHKSVLQLEKPIVKKEKQKFQLSVFPTITATTADGGPSPSAALGANKDITLTIKHWNGSTFDIQIDPNQYLDDLKEKIHDIHEIPIEQQNLIITNNGNNNPVVDDMDTLKDQNIVDKTTLTLGPIKVIVDVLGFKKKKFRFGVVPDDNIKRIKRLVTKKVGISVDRQIVMINGGCITNVVKDNQKLNEFNISHDETIITIDTYTVVVMKWDGTTIEIKDGVGPNDTLDDVKNILTTKLNMPKEQLKIFFQDKPINDYISLSNQQIHHKSVLNLQEPTCRHTKVKKEKFKLSIIGTNTAASSSNSNSNAAATTTGGGGGSGCAITVKHWKGETYMFETTLNEYVEDLKEKVETITKIPKAQQRLTFDGKTMEDDETLEENDITSSSATINLEPMRINVMLPTGRKIRFAITLDDTVKRIKKIVHKKSSSLQIESQCILLAGLELKDNQRLSETGIDHDDILTVESFTISILHLATGNLFVLTDIQPTDTIEDVRAIVVKRKQIPIEKQHYKFEGRAISDYLSLKDQQIKHKSILSMEDEDVHATTTPNSNKVITRPTTSELKMVDTDDEETLDGSLDFGDYDFGEDDADDDDDEDDDEDDNNSQSSWIKKIALDENYTANILTKIDDGNPEDSYLSKLAHDEKNKAAMTILQ